MVLTKPEKQEAEETLVEAAAELLSSSMAVKAQMIRPQRIQPLALVLSRNDDGALLVGVVAILDVEQRITTIRHALAQCGGYAFLFVYDGFITDGATKTDALLMVSGTAWGVWRASALPYQYSGVGASFLPTQDVPDVCAAYREVFSGSPYTIPEA